MALERLPLGGSPPPWDLGARFSQKSVWFVCPPKRKEDCGCQFFFRLARSVSCVGGLAK